jgi:carboxyl-terminal processing protease
LADGSAWRWTTRHYFTPSGKIIHGQGVTPDILVEEKKEDNSDAEQVKPPRGDGIFDGIEQIEKKDIAPKGSFDYKNDPQVMRAVNALQAIELYKQVKQ